MSTVSLLDRFLDPVVGFLPADAAQKIIDLRIDPELQSRLDELAEKAAAFHIARRRSCRADADGPSHRAIAPLQHAASG